MRCQVSFDNRYINYKLYKDYRKKFEHALSFTIEMKKRIDFAIEWVLNGHVSNISEYFLWISFYGSFYLIWFTKILLVTVAPPLKTLLTQFRKL